MFCPPQCECARHAGRNAKHGDTKGYRTTAEYYAWARMKRRGYVVDPNWINSFSAFLQDVGRKPSPEHRLVRVDRTGAFEPDNVAWVKPRRGRGRRA
jgi:hypothetical protein